MIKLMTILIVISNAVCSQTDTEILNKWTKINEAKLTNKYPIIQSPWFETECLTLAKNLQFKHLNSCQLFDSQIINAYVFDNGHVYFSKGMMQQINNKHQWAAILAHEYAHIVLGHYLKTIKKLKKPDVFFPKSKIKKMLKKHESEADDWSKQRLKSYNMIYNQINYFLVRVKALKINEKNNHLKLSNRIKKSKNPEIIDKEFIQSIKELNR